MYLFIFALLLVLFQYVNSKNVFENQTSKIEKLEDKITAYKDSVVVLNEANYDLSLFQLEQNDDALSYFEDQGYDTSTLIPLIKNELYSLNETKGEHPLIPYAGTGGNKMLINSIRLLNHKWIIANFSDAQIWGEMFFSFEIENGELKFKLIDSFLYPMQ
jgi:hypothetical protein